MFRAVQIPQADEAGSGLMGHLPPRGGIQFYPVKPDGPVWLRSLLARRGHTLAKRASISRHESGSRMPDQAGERIMSVQRVWKPVGSVNSNAEIERLRLELASFNERIEELEKQHPDALKIEALRVSALCLLGRLMKFAVRARMT